MSRAWIVVVCVALAAGAVAWSMCAQPRSIVAPERGGAPRAEAPHVAPLESPRAVPALREREVVPEPEPEVAAPEGMQLEEDPVIVPERTELQGTLVVVDSGGVEHRGEDGYFDLKLWDGNVCAGQRVEVVGGAWRVGIVPRTAVSGGNARMGERPVLLTDEHQPLPDVPWPDGFSVELRGQWLDDVTLRVLDADTGHDLEGVDLVLTGWHHDVGRRVLRHAASPLRFPPEPTATEVRYRASAPGYAFGEIELSYGDRGPHELRLVRGGGLEVRHTGAPVPEGAVLRLRRGDATAEVRAEIVREAELEKVTSFEGLPQGRYEITIEKGWSWSNPIVVAKASVEVVGGSVVPVDLVVLNTIRPPPEFPVSGTLHLPAAWQREDLTLAIEPAPGQTPWVNKEKWLALSEMRAVGPEEFAWEAGLLPAGDYRAVVHPCLVESLLHVAAPARADVRIEVPAPTEVALRFVDVDTGETVQPQHVYFAVARPDGFSGTVRVGADADGVYRFQALPSRIAVHASELPAGWWSKELDLHAGRNELSVDYERPCGVEVTVLDGERPARWQDEWKVRLRPLDDQGVRTVYWSRTRAQAPSAGRYRVAVSGEGGSATDEQTVMLQRGQWTKVVLRLRR